MERRAHITKEIKTLMSEFHTAGVVHELLISLVIWTHLSMSGSSIDRTTCKQSLAILILPK